MSIPYLDTSILKHINEYTHIISPFRPLATTPPTRCTKPPHNPFRHPQGIGVDFAFRFVLGENNQRKIARCDTSTLQGAIAELRKVQRDNFAPCDILMSHLATARYRTLPLSRVVPATQKPRFRLRNHTQSPPCDAYYIRSARARPTTFGDSARHWRRLCPCRQIYVRNAKKSFNGLKRESALD